jgi:hypothetical protein
MADRFEEPVFGIDEMVLRVEHHRGLRGSGADIGQRQKYAGRRVAITRLKKNRAAPLAVQLRQRFAVLYDRAA